MRAAIVMMKSLLGRGDEMALSRQFQTSGAQWDFPQFKAAALDCGLTTGRARRVIDRIFAERITEVSNGNGAMAIRNDYDVVAGRLGLNTQAWVQVARVAGERRIAQSYCAQVEAGSSNIDQLVADAAGFGIDKGRATVVLREVAENILSNYLADAMADGRFDPQEDAGLADLVQRLGVETMQWDAKTEATIREARELWRIENEPLPEVATSLLLRRGEVAYLCIPAAAAEQRTRTVRTAYAGTRARIKIMKGVYYSVGSSRVSRDTQAYEHGFGDGMLVMTNRRLIWSGDTKNISWNYDALIDYQCWSDAAEFSRGAGKPTRFYFAANPLVAAIISRILTDR